MNLKTTISIISSIVLTAVAVLYINDINSTKIAYVRTQELVYGYEGTKENQVRFNTKKIQWQANVDTLKSNFQNALKDYNAEYEGMNSNERKLTQKKLSEQEKQLEGYTQAISEKIEMEDNKMMEGVVNQINSFVKSYGEEKGYDVILGTTLSGNVMYAKDALDITDEIIKEINKNYLGE